MGQKITQIESHAWHIQHPTASIEILLQFGLPGCARSETIVKASVGFLGIPGPILMAYGLYGSLQIPATYNLTQEFALGHSLVYTIILLTGIFFVTSEFSSIRDQDHNPRNM